MRLIDMHCDTIWKLMDLDKKGNLEKNHCSVSISGMKKAGTIAQFFACFTYIEDYKEKDGYEGAWHHCLEMTEFLEKQVEMFPKDLAKVCSYKELKQNEAEGKISAFLTVEEAAC